MPTCQHNFHLECIDVWLQKQTTCPICRVSLKDQPGAKPTASPLRTLPQILGHAGSPVNRSPHWILPIHRDRAGGRQNSPASQESLEVIIEIQPQRQWGGYKVETVVKLLYSCQASEGIRRCRNHASWLGCSSCSTVVGWWYRNRTGLVCSSILCTFRAVA